LCKASIIIPHYNQTKFLNTILSSIANQTFDDYEVIIIDDCTNDGSTVQYIKLFIKDHKNMRLVENTENMRFIKTVNKGIRLANGEYICLLNCDTEVQRNFVERNVEILDSDASIAGVSCVILDKGGMNWWTGGTFREGFTENLTDDFEGIRDIDWVAGTAAFYRKAVFKQIGLFDESYRMYHEDVEFGLRIKAETNYRTCAFHDKLVVHYHELSIPSTEIRKLFIRNHILMVRRYCPRLLPTVIRCYWEAHYGSLRKDVLGLHPWLFLYHLYFFRTFPIGVLTGLFAMPSRRARLIEE